MSHRMHTLHTTLSTTQEWIVCELRRLLLLPLDDLTAIAKLFINCWVSVAFATARFLSKHSV